MHVAQNSAAVWENDVHQNDDLKARRPNPLKRDVL